MVLPVIGCPTPSCAFHAGAGAYFTCLAGGAGACFHFGAPCTPADACMFGAPDGLHHACDDISGGSCKRYGALCAP